MDCSNDKMANATENSMKRIRLDHLACHIVLTALIGQSIVAQTSDAVYIDPHVGNKLYRRSLIVNRNKVESIVFNKGTFGEPQNGTVSGAWPIGSGHGHVSEMSILVGAEVRGTQGQILHIVSESYGSNKDISPDGRTEYWWNPLPGYFNPRRRYVNPLTLRTDTTSTIATSTDATTWPSTWPGKDASWDGHWNGYFGKDQFTADQEAVYVIDDSYNAEFPYYPFANDSTRRGLGLQVETRLFQWSHPLAEDQVFIHFQVSNASDNSFDRTSTPIYFGAFADTHPGGEGDIDDMSGYNNQENMVFAWDYDNGRDSRWSTYRNILPGYIGWKYLESPGIGGDGVDNDNDGLLDETRDNSAGTWVFGSVGMYDVPKWHWSGDEDGDWQREVDDVGADGIGILDPKYDEPDQDGTEGNGQPDQGEPNFGKTDNDESDQIGLTSFCAPVYGTLQISNDEAVWNYITSGQFQTPAQNENNCWVFASGPFDMQKGKTERFSVCWLFGNDLVEIMRNALTSQRIYDNDYRFASPPTPPTVKAVAGDKKVTLYWDDIAERSRDPLYGKDFEGYRIYRGTNPQLSEADKITDAYGSLTYKQPIAQFDLNDGVKGIHPVALGSELGDQYSTGIHYNMGDDTGLQHYFEDENVVNGVTYYYVVVSYDKGYYAGMDDRNLIPMTPYESPYNITVEYGELVGLSFNAVVVTPNAPASNYVAGKVDESSFYHASGGATGTITTTVVDADQLPDNHVFELTFGTTPGVENGIGIPYATNFSLRDTTINSPLQEMQHAAIPLKRLVVDSLSKMTTYDWQRYDSSWTSNVVSGLALNFTNPTPTILAIRQRSGWQSGSKTTANVDVSYTDTTAYTYPISFRIEITDTISGKGYASMGASSATVNTRFRIVDVATGQLVPFYLYQTLVSRKGFWDKNDPLYIGLRKADGTCRWVWRLNQVVFPETILPTGGDVYEFVSPIPFSTSDTLYFRTTSSKTIRTDQSTALAKVAVVPNPYLLTASWEQGSSMPGRGERKVSFIHLPSVCTISIYTQNGVLIRKIDHSGNIADGSETWDLTTSEGLEVAFGIYVYYIQAGDIGTKIGTFAIIN